MGLFPSIIVMFDKRDDFDCFILKVKWGVSLQFAKAMGFFSTIVAMLSVCGFQVLTVAGTFWLSDWSENSYLANTTNRYVPDYAGLNKSYLVGYTLFGIFQGIYYNSIKVLYSVYKATSHSTWILINLD